MNFFVYMRFVFHDRLVFRWCLASHNQLSLFLDSFFLPAKSSECFSKIFFQLKKTFYFFLAVSLNPACIMHLFFKLCVSLARVNFCQEVVKDTLFYAAGC